MAQQTVCDLCDEGEPLHPSTGMYELIVRKITRVDGDTSTHQEDEFDVCGACMQKIRQTAPAAFKKRGA